MKFILLLTITFFLSLLSVYLVRKFAYVNNFTISQQEDRWHKGTIALYGGAGFIPVFILASFFYIWFHLSGDYKIILSLDKNHEIVVLLAILLGASLMFVVGIIDDVKSLGIRNKLFFQAVAASIFLTFSEVIFINEYPLLNIFITYFWFIGIINAVNLLDNMDGLASGVVIISLLAAIFFIIEFSTSVQSFSWEIILLLIVSIIAFWLFNFPPATIFMGDCGSLPLGFLLASFCSPNSLNNYFLSVNTNSYSLFFGLIISVAIVSVPIFDTAFVTITRKLEARKITHGDRDHTSHRLLVLGINERKVLLFFYVLSILGVGVALMIAKYPIYWAPSIIFLLLNMLMLGVYIGRIKVTASNSDRASFHIMINRLVEVLLDIGIFSFCFYVSFIFRFGANLSIELKDLLYFTLPVVIGSSLISFSFFGIYKIKMKSISTSDYLSFVKGSIGALILSLALLTLLFRFPEGSARSIFLIYSLLLFLISFIVRYSYGFIDSILVKINKIFR